MESVHFYWIWIVTLVPFPVTDIAKFVSKRFTTIKEAGLVEVLVIDGVYELLELIDKLHPELLVLI